jgi:hypothetical protein
MDESVRNFYVRFSSELDEYYNFYSENGYMLSPHCNASKIEIDAVKIIIKGKRNYICDLIQIGIENNLLGKSYVNIMESLRDANSNL